MTTTSLRRAGCALLAAIALPALADEYDNMFVDTSLLVVARESAAREVMKMLAEGESFQTMAVALSTDKSAARGGRRGVTTCYQFNDPGYAKLLCTSALDTPIANYFTKPKYWGITLIHARGDKPAEIGKRGFAVPIRSEPDAFFSCRSTLKADAPLLTVQANTRSRSSYINKARAYLKITDAQLVFLTGMGQQLVIDRSNGSARFNDLETQRSGPMQCGPGKAPPAGEVDPTPGAETAQPAQPPASS